MLYVYKKALLSNNVLLVDGICFGNKVLHRDMKTFGLLNGNKKKMLVAV